MRIWHLPNVAYCFVASLSFPKRFELFGFALNMKRFGLSPVSSHDLKEYSNDYILV